jgi:hypothetical protein
MVLERELLPRRRCVNTYFLKTSMPPFNEKKTQASTPQPKNQPDLNSLLQQHCHCCSSQPVRQPAQPFEKGSRAGRHIQNAT